MEVPVSTLTNSIIKILLEKNNFSVTHLHITFMTIKGVDIYISTVHYSKLLWQKLYENSSLSKNFTSNPHFFTFDLLTLVSEQL